jgi:hypothetical protein
MEHCDYCMDPVFDVKVMGTAPYTYSSKVCEHHYYKTLEMA